MFGLEGARKRVDTLSEGYRLARDRVSAEQQGLERSRAVLGVSQEAQTILQGISQTLQQRAHSQIAEIVSRCLEAVFGEEAYSFMIRFEQKRGKTEAVLLFSRRGKEVDPLEASGGGVVDVAAFALRLAALILSRPSRRKVLILDEPFKHVSRDYTPAIRGLLVALAQEMKIQFVIVTHNRGLKVGKIIELE